MKKQRRVEDKDVGSSVLVYCNHIVKPSQFPPLLCEPQNLYYALTTLKLDESFKIQTNSHSV